MVVSLTLFFILFFTNNIRHDTWKPRLRKDSFISGKLTIIRWLNPENTTEAIYYTQIIDSRYNHLFKITLFNFHFIILLSFSASRDGTWLIQSRKRKRIVTQCYVVWFDSTKATSFYNGSSEPFLHIKTNLIRFCYNGVVAQSCWR